MKDICKDIYKLILNYGKFLFRGSIEQGAVVLYSQNCDNINVKRFTLLDYITLTKP